MIKGLKMEIIRAVEQIKTKLCVSLSLIFVILKITGTINWSWLWVFSPIWGGVLFGFSFLGLLVMIDYWEDEQKKSKNG